MTSTEGAQASSAEAHPSSKDTIENIVALSSKSEYLERRPLKDFFLDLRFRIMAHRQFLGALVFLLLAVALLMATWRGSLTTASPPSGAELKPVSPPVEATKPVVPLPVASAPAVAPTGQAPANQPPASQAAAATPSVVTTPAASAVASAPVVAKAPPLSGAGCAYTEGKATEVVSASANKPPNYVFVVSPLPTTVCVVDGSKKASVLELRPNEGRSVYGNPPWQLSGNALKDVQVFFQGVRVKMPEANGQPVTLLEKPSAP